MKRIFLVILILNFQFLFFNSAKAQDLYQIEQSFDHDFSVTNLVIESGWDARLIQVPKGTSTRVVITTPCANFFEEGEEPNLLSVDKFSKRECYYTLKQNQWMPHSTIVEIFTAQPINNITLKKNANLTIQHFDFDSIELEISADSGALLVVDTLLNRYNTIITLTSTVLDLRHVTGGKTDVNAYAHSNVIKGDVQGDYHQSDYDRAQIFFGPNLYFGLSLSGPLAFSSNKYGSPYNTNHNLGLFILMNSSDISLGGRWAWNFGIEGRAYWMELDNIVKVQDDKLVLDASYGATPPRQSLYYWSLGLPVSLKLNLWPQYFINGLYARLTPTYNFVPRLRTSNLDADNKRHSDLENADILNHFNIRTAIGLNHFSGGLEFFIDLLPTYKPSADAPQMRMMGLNYHF